MIRLVLFSTLFLAFASIADAQTREVTDGQLDLEVSVVGGATDVYAREMVLITIHGTYRRHITREKLEQPELEGFNWSQLGTDRWYETIEAGKRIKNFERRMALYPDGPGRLTIPPFVHHLTLTDEGDDWFPHDIRSEPITVDVQPVPETGGGWWFPVRGLRVSDEWSNAPDQLTEGEGVLRVIRIEATGATPEMIPPMPELTSPSAMIFAHPERRFVELSPEGPVTYAFWRWTVRPTNGTSAILEPLEIEYFDTKAREQRRVEIGAQRIAYGTVTGPARSEQPGDRATPTRGSLSRAPLLGMTGLGALLGLGVMLAGRRTGGAGWRRLPGLDPRRRAVASAARRGDAAGLWRAARALMASDPGVAARPEARGAVDILGRSIFGAGTGPAPDLKALARPLLRRKRSSGDT
ncbi:hypothetical protein [Roseivivax marinus]|uniref:hypothetical protein n=1 Tax=Roseivivax marinus TaxID=1379903 RepID=UPI00273DF3FF|nr:hypothetical protein [Roseivivax marinus]